MSIRLNTQHLSSKEPASSSAVHLQYGSKDDVGFDQLFRFFHQAFPLAFNRETFERVYDASDVSRTAYRTRRCWTLKVYAALLATSVFDANQQRQLKILMLVEDEHSSHAVHLGKRLLQQTIETCKELENVRQIYAYVESTNFEGIQLYKAMGFQQREFLPDYFSQRASLAPDAIKLEYRIATSMSSEQISGSKMTLSPVSTKYTVRIE